MEEQVASVVARGSCGHHPVLSPSSGVATIAVPGSWMLIVDSWPASGRLYIGGSTDNTVLDLALGCSGFGRVEETDLRWTYKRSARGRSIGA